MRKTRATATPDEMFWRHTVPPEDPESCWGWTGSITVGPRGLKYPRFMHKYTKIWAHRFACELLNGVALNRKIHARHLCGNSMCVNPNHMTWGTASDNSDDMLWHGTRMRGEAHHQAKLTEADVLYIRASDKSGAELGRELGVTKEAIYLARNYQSWQHLP